MQTIMDGIMGGTMAGKVALITCGVRCQGRAAALRFAQEGAKVALSDVNAEGGVQTMHMVQENGGEGYFLVGGASAEGSARGMGAAAGREYCGLDIPFKKARIVWANNDG